MILIAKFTGDYYTVDKHGNTVVIPNIEREVVYDPDENKEEIYFAPSESKKIELYLTHFTTATDTPLSASKQSVSVDYTSKQQAPSKPTPPANRNIRESDDKPL